MKFEEGDIVRCVQPLSYAYSLLNLSDEELYVVTYSDGNIVRLAGHMFNYDFKRFVHANDIEDTGVDFF